MSEGTKSSGSRYWILSRPRTSTHSSDCDSVTLTPIPTIPTPYEDYRKKAAGREIPVVVLDPLPGA